MEDTEYNDPTLTFVRADLKAIADDLANARVELDKAADAEKAARAVYEQYESELFTALENAQLLQFRTERGLFSRNELAWAKVENEDTARAWAEANLPELLLLNRQRLSVIVREYLKGERDELPPGVDFTTSRKITWRRS